MSFSKTKGQFRTKVSGTFRTRVLSFSKPSTYRPITPERQHSAKASDKLGLCECGCGKQTSSIVTGNSRDGYVFGGFRKFIAGHQWLLKRAAKPEGWKSSYELIRERDRVRIDLARKVSGLASELKTNVVDFATIQTRFQPSVFGKRINNNGVSKMLRIAAPYASVYIPKLISIRAVTRPPAPISIHYPFFGSIQNDLIAFVQSIIPERIGRATREDISQNILLALVAGNITRETAKESVPRFIAEYYHQFGNWRHISLDAPIGDDNNSTLYDRIDNVRPFGYKFSQPDEVAIRKEEWEEERRYENFFSHNEGEKDELTYSLAEAGL